MKISPQVARIIDFQKLQSTIYNNKQFSCKCPFCKSELEIQIPHSILCSFCPHKFAIYPFSPPAKQGEEFVFDCLKFSMEVKAETEIQDVFKNTKQGTKMAFQITQNYSNNSSQIMSYKGRPVTLKFDSILDINFEDIDSIISKVKTYLLFS